MDTKPAAGTVFRRLDSNQDKTQSQSLAGCQLPYAGLRLQIVTLWWADPCGGLMWWADPPTIPSGACRLLWSRHGQN